jgi:hypothetical protein
LLLPTSGSLEDDFPRLLCAASVKSKEWHASSLNKVNRLIKVCYWCSACSWAWSIMKQYRSQDLILKLVLISNLQ